LESLAGSLDVPPGTSLSQIFYKASTVRMRVRPTLVNVERPRTSNTNEENERKKYMSKINVVRAWKDAKFRQSLSAEEQAMLPANPVGRVELSDAQLSVSGAKGTETTQETLCTHPMFCTRLSCPTYLFCPGPKQP